MLAERAREQWPLVAVTGVLTIVLITGLVALGGVLAGSSSARYRRQLERVRGENSTLASELSSASQELRASQAELATTRAQLSAGQAAAQRGARAQYAHLPS